MDEPDSPKKATILAVDDTPDNLALISNLLKDDYQVKIANDGEKALQIAASDAPPDLILLDVMMPGMDGYEVCRRLKRDPKTMNIPVIFITAKGEVADETKGLELGAIDYITKPFSPPIVLARVKSHLATKIKADLLRDQGDWDTAERLAHTLKSLSSNVGLTDLQQLAEKLEAAIKLRRSGDEAGARLDSPTLIAQMTVELPEEQGKTAITVNREKLKEVCEQLEAMLDSGDGDAADVLDANAELLDAAYPDHARQIDNSIRSFDFGAALAALRAATGTST